MLAAGVGFVALGKWFARNDAAWLSGVIGQALGQPVAGVMTPVTEVDATAVPGVLKGVALFLAAWSVMLIVMNFFGSRMMPAQPTNPAGVALGHWQLGYAVAALVLAAGVWRRRPWAWWGGFLLFGLAIVTSLLAMPVNVEPPTPPVIRVIFGIFCSDRGRGLGTLVVCTAAAFLVDEHGGLNANLGGCHSTPERARAQR